MINVAVGILLFAVLRATTKGLTQHLFGERRRAMSALAITSRRAD